MLKRVRNRETKDEHRDVGKYLNKQRTLVFSSRGIVHRDRHLMTDLRDLLPHSRSETKLDTKDALHEVSDLAELKNCNNVVFFEARKHKDLYLHLGRCPSGPTIKFLVQHIHTMSEIKLTGNCLKGSRPLLQFDQSFNDAPHSLLMKELLGQAFGSPKGHPKVKPFVDHVFSFFYQNGQIFFRNYQISYDANQSTQSDGEPILVEIGPRFTLTPIKILAGSFNGAVLWENPKYVSPNIARAILKRKTNDTYVNRTNAKKARSEHEGNNQTEEDVHHSLFE